MLLGSCPFWFIAVFWERSKNFAARGLINYSMGFPFKRLLALTALPHVFFTFDQFKTFRLEQKSDTGNTRRLHDHIGNENRQCLFKGKKSTEKLVLHIALSKCNWNGTSWMNRAQNSCNNISSGNKSLSKHFSSSTLSTTIESNFFETFVSFCGKQARKISYILRSTTSRHGKRHSLRLSLPFRFLCCFQSILTRKYVVSERTCFAPSFPAACKNLLGMYAFCFTCFLVVFFVSTWKYQ